MKQRGDPIPRRELQSSYDLDIYTQWQIAIHHFVEWTLSTTSLGMSAVT